MLVENYGLMVGSIEVCGLYCGIMQSVKRNIRCPITLKGGTWVHSDREAVIEGYDLMLWGDLHTMFEPNEDDELWKNQHQYNLLSWSLYDFCGIHMLLMENGMAIHMLTEKKYPLSQEMISKMLKKRLEVDHESTQAIELLRFIRSQVQK
ncbi:hypothetical protein Tco_0347502 [Tanacetum coccineum]